MAGDGLLGIHPLVRGFMAVWFGGIIAFAIGGLVSLVVAIVTGSMTAEAWLVVAGALALLLFGAGLVWVGRFKLAGGDDEHLVQFVVEAVDGQVLEASA